MRVIKYEVIVVIDEDRKVSDVTEALDHLILESDHWNDYFGMSSVEIKKVKSKTIKFPSISHFIETDSMDDWVDEASKQTDLIKG